MFVYIGVYIFLVMAAIIHGKRSRKKNIIIFYCSFLLLFMGTRFEVGCDFIGYLHRFLFEYDQFDLSYFITFKEPAFHILTATIRELDLGYMWLNISASAIYLFGIYHFSKLSDNPVMLIALFFPVMIVLLGMSGLRQMLAVGFVLLGLVSFTNKKTINTALFIGIGSLFHMSAIVFLPVAYLAGRKVSLRKLILAVLVLGPVAVVVLSDRLGLYQDRYISQIYGDMSASGGLLRFPLLLIPAFLFIKFRKKMKIFYPRTFELMSLYTLFTIALIPIALLSSFALHRFVYYVMPVSILTFISLSTVIFPKQSRKLGSMIPVIIYGVYFIGWFSLSQHGATCYNPYQSYLFMDSGETQSILPDGSSYSPK